MTARSSTSTRASPKRHRVSGYALLEALVAIVVAAVGFVGAARLQTVGLTINNSTQARQKALLLAYQMADRVRANQAGVAAHAYDAPAAGDTSCLYGSSGCTAAQVAAADIAEWQAEIAGQLPGGAGVVCLDSTPDDGDAGAPQCDGAGGIIAVKLWWTDKMGTPRFVVAVRP